MNQSPSIPWGSYHDMVVSLAKVMPGHGADLLHAAVGISGEVAELFQSTSAQNMAEECGDIEFYIELGWQALERAGFKASRERERGAEGLSCLGYNLQDLVISSGQFLDLAKKAWVYNKPIDHIAITDNLYSIELDLDDFYRSHGLDGEMVRHNNMAKLALRYGAKYSDAAAQARADKAGEANG